jgi:hypothetical protein
MRRSHLFIVALLALLFSLSGTAHGSSFCINDRITKATSHPAPARFTLTRFDATMVFPVVSSRSVCAFDDPSRDDFYGELTNYYRIAGNKATFCRSISSSCKHFIKYQIGIEPDDPTWRQGVSDVGAYERQSCLRQQGKSSTRVATLGGIVGVKVTCSMAPKGYPRQLYQSMLVSYRGCLYRMSVFESWQNGRKRPAAAASRFFRSLRFLRNVRKVCHPLVNGVPAPS